MVFSESALVVAACTLAGGVGERNRTTPEVGSCRVGTQFLDCAGLDREVDPRHTLVLWCATLACTVLLGMPTILGRSAQKEEAMRCLAAILFQTLCLMVISMASEHPSLNYTLSAHGSVLLLSRMDVGRPLVGGGKWWSIRYAMIVLILAYVALQGPAVAVVRWPGAGDTLSCAYIAHLAGCIWPTLALDGSALAMRAGGWLALRPM